MEKEMVQKFDLEAAFKALDEIDTPKAKGLKANRVDLKERFAAKSYGDALIEDYYNVNDKEALEEAKEDREEEIAKAKLARIEKIVDLDAESPEDLLPSYVGKVIIQCPQCMTLFYKNPEDIEKSEENPDVVNINEICQHCGNASGYTLIGKVGEVSPDEAANYEAAEEGTEEDELNLDFGEPTEEVSPEGTGGGFEEEEIAVEEGSDDSSDDELDLDLSEVELESAEESLKREQLNESVEKVVAFLDCSGSWTPEKISNCEKRAKEEEHAGKVFFFSDHIYDNMDEAIKGGRTSAGSEIIAYVKANPETKVVIYTDDDMKYQGGEALFDGTLPNVKLIRVDLGESLEEELTPAEVEQRLTAYAASLGVEEGYTGNPAERTTHLEYTDDDPTDGKAVLPDNIEKQLTEEEKKACPDCGKEICECGDKKLAEGTYDVSDADFRAMLKDKTFQEFGEALTEGKVSTAAVDKAVSEISAIGAEDVEEDVNITSNDSPGRIDNRNITKEKEDSVAKAAPIENAGEVVDAKINELFDSKVTKIDASPKISMGGLDAGGLNLAVDASGQNNAAGFGGSQPKVESCEHCEGEECKDCKEDLAGDVRGLMAELDAREDKALTIQELDTIAAKYGVKAPYDKAILDRVTIKEGIGGGLVGGGLGAVGGAAIGGAIAGPIGAAVGAGLGGVGGSIAGDKIGDKLSEEKEEEGLLPGLPGLPGLSEKCEDLHEESLNKHISAYLTEVYANVKDFTATNCSLNGTKLVVEGTINFNSGKSRATKFEFTEAKNGEAGKIILEGYNKDLAEDAHFTLNCLLEDGGTCLLTEGFGYKYTINNTLVEGLK